MCFLHNDLKQNVAESAGVESAKNGKNQLQISAGKISHEHSNRDLNQLWKLSPGMRVFKTDDLDDASMP